MSARTGEDNARRGDQWRERMRPGVGGSGETVGSPRGGSRLTNIGKHRAKSGKAWQTSVEFGRMMHGTCYEIVPACHFRVIRERLSGVWRGRSQLTRSARGFRRHLSASPQESSRASYHQVSGVRVFRRRGASPGGCRDAFWRPLGLASPRLEQRRAPPPTGRASASGAALRMPR